VAGQQTEDRQCPQAYAAEIEKTTVAVALTRIQDGRTLRTMVERAHASVTEELGEVSSAARQAFAEMVDYLTDYKDANDLYSMAQRLDVDRDIEKFLKTISGESAAVGADLRSGRFRLRGEPPGREPMDMTHIYLVLAPGGTLPSTVRVPKSFQFG
jgi:hypothetical protein